MKRRGSKPKAAWTAEQIKALIEAQDWVCQARLFQLLLSDPSSPIGAKIRSLVAYGFRRIDDLEAKAGVAPGDIDPEELLRRDETLKEARRRLGKPSTSAVKLARHRAKLRMAEYTSLVDQARRVTE
jgi:hypothetical protein